MPPLPSCFSLTRANRSIRATCPQCQPSNSMNVQSIERSRRHRAHHAPIEPQTPYRKVPNARTQSLVCAATLFTPLANPLCGRNPRSPRPNKHWRRPGGPPPVCAIRLLRLRALLLRPLWLLRLRLLLQRRLPRRRPVEQLGYGHGWGGHRFNGDGADATTAAAGIVEATAAATLAEATTTARHAQGGGHPQGGGGTRPGRRRSSPGWRRTCARWRRSSPGWWRQSCRRGGHGGSPLIHSSRTQTSRNNRCRATAAKHNSFALCMYPPF